MQLNATLYTDDEIDLGARTSERLVVERVTTLRDDRGIPHSVEIDNLSSSGCFVSTSLPLQVGQSIRIGLAGVGSVAGYVVRQQGGGFGCRFETLLSGADVGRAFAASTVVMHPANSGTFSAELVEVERWPGAVRIGIITTLTAASWALVLALVR